MAHRVRPGAPTSPSSSRPAPPWASSRPRCGRAASPTASTPAPSSTRRTRSGPCSWPCASSTTRRTSSPSSASCARRSTAAATWTSTAGGCSGAAAGTRGHRGRSASRTTTPSGTPWPTSSSASAPRAWLTPSQQLDSLVRDRRVLEAALAGPSPLDAWHRVRFVLEQARAWTEAGGRFLRDYLEWTRRQTGLTGRVAEAVLEDGEAVEERADGQRRPRGRRGRRRGADPDRPRLQGPGVPDHRRVRLQQPARRAAPRRAGGLRPRRRDDPPPPPGARAARVRRQPRHRRADGRARAHPPALRGLHPGA